VAALATAAVMIAAAACSGQPTAAPPPTSPPMHAELLPSVTLTPTATETLVPTATFTPAPTATAVFDTSSGGEPEPGCELPLTGATWSVAPADDAPDEVRVEWSASVTRTISAEVVEHDAEAKRYVLKALDGPGDYAFWLRYSEAQLPLETGRRYRFLSHQDPPDGAATGSALRIDDDSGVLFFGLSVRETEGALEAVLGGDRGGFVVRQLPTTCVYAPIDACGYELRAAPAQMKRGEATLTLTAGQTGTLASDPPYEATIYTSHYRLWRQDVPCSEPTDWILSYQLVRQ
jgi:hypothetical protein